MRISQEDSQIGGRVKEKLKKTAIYFLSFLLPLSWLHGFARAMAFRYDLRSTSMVLYVCLTFVSFIFLCIMWRDMYERGIRGWYSVVCIILSFAIGAGVILWLHYALWYFCQHHVATTQVWRSIAKCIMIYSVIMGKDCGAHFYWMRISIGRLPKRIKMSWKKN